MAAETTDMLTGGTGAHVPNYRKDGVIQLVLDYALWLAAKGSALEAGDIAQVFRVPAGCVVECANISPVTDKAANAEATVVTLDLGDGTGAARYVDGYDGTAETEGVPVMTVEKFYPAADTVDVTLQALTGTLSTGQVKISIRVFELTA